MADCQRLQECSLFHDQLKCMPKTAARMKAVYCKGDKTVCARYLLAAKGTQPPSDLFPNETEWARRILSKIK